LSISTSRGVGMNLDATIAVIFALVVFHFFIFGGK